MIDQYLRGKFARREGDSTIDHLSRMGIFGGLAEIHQMFQDAKPATPQQAPTYTDHERESAKACGCQACREKYDLPHEAREMSTLQAFGVVAVAGALGFGLIKMLNSKQEQTSGPDGV